MSDSNEVVTDPRLEKCTRRRFSVTEKKRLLAEADDLGTCQPFSNRSAYFSM